MGKDCKERFTPLREDGGHIKMGKIEPIFEGAGVDCTKYLCEHSELAGKCVIITMDYKTARRDLLRLEKMEDISRWGK